MPTLCTASEADNAANCLALGFVTVLASTPPVADLGSDELSNFSHSLPAPPAWAASDGMWT